MSQIGLFPPEHAWTTLTMSAIIERLAVTLFAANMLMTFTTGSPPAAFLESQQESGALDRVQDAQAV